MRNDIKKLVRECDVSQTNKHENLYLDGLLQPIPIPNSPWLDISMNFIEGLPLSKGFFVILTVVGKFTKFPHSFLLTHPFTSIRPKYFFSGVFKLHGMP